MKKYIAILLMFLMLLMIVSACAQTPTTTPASTTTKATTKATSQTSSTTTSGEPEPVTLTIFSDAIGEYNAESEVALEITKRTGVTVDFSFATTDDSSELTLMVATNALPDIIVIKIPSPFRASLWSQDYLQPMNDLFDQYAPEAWNDVPENMDKFWTEDDGNWYFIPAYYGDVEKIATIDGAISVNQGFSMYAPVYEELGKPSIATMEDYKALLMTVKEKYPGKFDFLIHNRQINQIGSTFGFNMVEVMNRSYGGADYKTVDEQGNVHFSFRDESYKKAILFLNDLYLSGLLNPEIFTTTDTIVEIAGNRKIFSHWGQGIALMATDETAGVDYNVYEMPRDAGVELKLKNINSSIGSGRAAAITKMCKETERATKFLAFLLADEGQMLLYHGIEGLHYDIVEGYPKNTEYKQKLWDEGFAKMVPVTGIWSPLTLFPKLSTDNLYYYWMFTDRPYYGQQIEVNEKYSHVELMENLAKVPSDSDEAVIEAKVMELWNNTLSQIILAASPAECISRYEKFISDVEGLGVAQLEAAYTDVVKGWLEKLG